MKARLGLAVAALAAAVAHAELHPGDVAVVAYNSDAPDDFAWVTFTNLPAGTVLNFTDSSVSNGYFRITEHLATLLSSGPLTWSDTNDIPAGTVIHFNGIWDRGLALGPAMDLSTLGDQIFLYTGVIVTNQSLVAPWLGDPAAAVLLFGINFGNGGWDNVSGGETTTSFVPPGLSVAAGTAVYTDAHDNGYYHGPTAGTADELRRALADPANWVTSDNPFDETNWPAAFEILPPSAGLFPQFR